MSKLNEEKKPIVSFIKSQNVVGRSIFNFPNGDIYIGSYGFIPPDTLFRQGRGMYLCADKTVIVGEWDDNEFIYGRVKFPNGEEYFGNFLFSQYCGDGLYKVPGVGTVIGTFSGCSLLNEVTLADINGFTWRGEATGNSAILYPVNQFLESSYYVGDTNVVPKATKDNLTTLYRAGLRKSSKVSLGPSTTGKSSRSRGSRKFHHK